MSKRHCVECGAPVPEDNNPDVTKVVWRRGTHYLPLLLHTWRWLAPRLFLVSLGICAANLGRSQGTQPPATLVIYSLTEPDAGLPASYTAPRYFVVPPAPREELPARPRARAVELVDPFRQPHDARRAELVDPLADVR